VGGKKEDAAPMLIADEPDMPGNSGPTVVDDAKVAEVLKKLRSLDVQSGPPGGVTEVVLDSGSSEPTRLDSGSIEIDSGPVIDRSGVEKLLRSSQRTTALGRSLATPVVGQPVTIPADLARGTLFGRSIHVPDVNAPDAGAVDLDSGAVAFLDGTPPPSQPFPLADNLVLPPPTSQPLQVYDAGTGSFSETGLNTQLMDPPKSRAFAKTIAFLGGIGIIAGGFWAWQRYGKSVMPDAPTPAATAPAPEPAKPAPPPSDPMPPAAAAAEQPAAAAAKPSAPPAPAEAAPAPNPAKPESAHAADVPAKPTAGDEPAPPPRAKESSRHSGHRSSSSSERRSAKPAAAPSPPPPDTSDAAEKPGHGKKHPVDDDPDNTMAPSI